MQNKISNYCRLLEQKAVRNYPNCLANQHKYTYSVGKKYTRIIQCDYKGEPASVFCFVDMQGNLYKADGWNKPAKGVRGHIDNPILELRGFYK